jgi:hypothetical protein
MTAKKQTRKSFSFVDQSDADTAVEPIEFEVNSEVFQAHPRIAGWVLLDIAGAINDDSSSGSSRAGAFRSLISQALLDEDNVRRFTKVVSDPVTGPDVNGLVEIATWLIDQYTGRPTEPSPVS